MSTKKCIGIALTIAGILAASGITLAKEKELAIQENSSGLSAELSANIGRAAVGMGVKEPLVMRSSQEDGKRYAIVSGSGSTVCKVKLSADAEPKILGLSCK